MAGYEMTAVPPGQEGDFAVRVSAGDLGRYADAGQTVYLRRSVQLENGDVGLFLASDGMVFRQYCRDSEGIIYLFSLDRSRKNEDIRIPVSGEKPVCFGKLVLDKPIPLPTD